MGRTRGQEELLPRVVRVGMLYTLRLGEGEGKRWEVSTESSHVREGLQGAGRRPCPYGLINVVFRSGINIKIIGRFLVGCYDPAVIYIPFYLSLLQFMVGGRH